MASILDRGRGGRLYAQDARLAGWQSGYAEDCKSSYSGSIPLPASKAKVTRAKPFFAHSHALVRLHRGRLGVNPV
jgi:hypothetical protein